MIHTLAKITSYVFHPILYLLYNLFLLLTIKGFWFGIQHWSEKKLLLLLVGVYSLIIPVLSIVMLKFLKVIQSIEMKERQDRIFPLIICMIFYLWLWINLKSDPAIPNTWIIFVLTSVVVCGLSLAINNWIKLSIHVASIVAMLMQWLAIRIIYKEDGLNQFVIDRLGNVKLNLDYFIMILIIVTGWIATSRLLLHQHSAKEIIVGAGIGIFSFFITYTIVY